MDSDGKKKWFRNDSDEARFVKYYKRVFDHCAKTRGDDGEDACNYASEKALSYHNAEKGASLSTYLRYCLSAGACEALEARGFRKERIVNPGHSGIIIRDCQGREIDYCIAPQSVEEWTQKEIPMIIGADEDGEEINNLETITDPAWDFTADIENRDDEKKPHFENRESCEAALCEFEDAISLSMVEIERCLRLSGNWLLREILCLWLVKRYVPAASIASKAGISAQLLEHRINNQLIPLLTGMASEKLGVLIPTELMKAFLRERQSIWRITDCDSVQYGVKPLPGPYQVYLFL